MKTALLNQLIDTNKLKLKHEERKEIILELRDTYGFSFHAISKITNIPKTTLFHWINPRGKMIKHTCQYWINNKCTKNDD